MNKLLLCIKLVAVDWFQSAAEFDFKEAFKMVGLILLIVTAVLIALGMVMWPIVWLVPYAHYLKDAGHDFLGVTVVIAIISIVVLQCLVAYFGIGVYKKCKEIPND